MFKFRKLSAEEISRLKKPKLQIDLSEYESVLRGMSIGDGGYLIPDEGEDPRVVKRRLTLAAHNSGYEIVYKKQPDGKWAWRLARPLTQRAS